MNYQKFKRLQCGDIIRHESGNIYQITKVDHLEAYGYIEVVALWSSELPETIGWSYRIYHNNYEVYNLLD